MRCADGRRRGASPPSEAGSTVLVVGAGGVGQFASRGRASRVPVTSSPSIPTRSGSSSCAASVRPMSCSRTVSARSCRTISGRRRLHVRRGRRSGDDEGRVPLDTERRPVRHRRPACGGRPARARPTEFIRREKRLTGTIYGSEDPAVALPVLLGHVRSGALDLRSQLGPQFSLDDANDAVEAALAGVPGRVLVTP